MPSHIKRGNEMTIHPRPDQELAIQAAISAGLIKTEVDALDIGLENLREKLAAKFSKKNGPKRNSFAAMFDSIRGDDLDFTRNPSTGRPINL